MINRDTLVISNPGTGKTTMISNEVINLIKEGVKPEKILCITFPVDIAILDSISVTSALGYYF